LVRRAGAKVPLVLLGGADFDIESWADLLAWKSFLPVCNVAFLLAGLRARRTKVPAGEQRCPPSPKMLNLVEIPF
jgi:hypothetical protein